MTKKILIEKLQNEKAAKEYNGVIEIGKTYELPIKGKCVFHSNSYHLEDNQGKILRRETGFPIGTASDEDENKYGVWLDKTGVVLYLKVSDRSSTLS